MKIYCLEGCGGMEVVRPTLQTLLLAFQEKESVCPICGGQAISVLSQEEEERVSDALTLRAYKELPDWMFR